MQNIRITNRITDDVYYAYGDNVHMVLKSVKDKNEVDIGLGMRMPNFVNYYHVNSNVAPFIDVGDEYRSLPGTYHHIFMERVKGITLADAINVLHMDDIIAIVVQVLMALYEAYTLNGFEHGDLHCYNIIVRRLDKPEVLHYDALNTSMLVNYLAVMIDYGYSTTNSIKAPNNRHKASVNDIHRLYSSICDVMNRSCMDYKRTIFYDRLKNIMKQYNLEDDYGPMDNWSPGCFNLIPVECNLDIPITIDNILKEINNMTYSNNNTLNQPNYIPTVTIPNVLYNPIQNVKDTKALKALLPHMREYNILYSHDRLLLDAYNNYARNVAVIILLQDGIIDDDIRDALIIIKVLSDKHCIKQLYRDFFQDILVHID